MPTSKFPILTPQDDIQDPNLHWRSTICFRRLRRRNSELSRLHWTSVLGAHYIQRENSTIGPSDKLCLVDQSIPFKGNMLPLTQTEMKDWLAPYQNEVRNSVLVLCSGALETYLKRAALLYLLCSGYARTSDRFKLNDVGSAIGKPVINRSTVPEQLKYVQSLFGIDFKKHVHVWEKAYKDRCTLAHQAGVISNTNQEDLASYDENVQTDWPTLLQVLNSTNQIAVLVDQKVSSGSTRLLELELELATLKLAGKLPNKPDIWTYVHKELGCAKVAKEAKKRIEGILY